MRRASFLLMLCLALARTTRPCRAAENWSDRSLKVTAGLELWLDASRLNAGRAADGKPALKNGDALDLWHDASGHKRHVAQSLASRRPSFQADLVQGQAAQAGVRFDGVDDFLAITGLGQALTDATIVVLAAPYGNAGGYRAFLAMNETGRNDYTSGLNIDQGHEYRDQFDRLNVEGSGCSGEVNLMSGAFDFGAFHIVTVTSSADKGQTRLYLDGKLAGRRSRKAGTIRMDEVRIGCRHYSNTAVPAAETGFFEGCIAEILVYSKALGDEERRSVEAYLRDKHADLLRLQGLGRGPLVHMLVPGFTVRELPVRLTNINALTYAPDGRLFALGYDGRIHVLRDTDGDGLEDQAEIFWDQPTLRTPVAMAWRPEGLYVVSNSKVSLFRAGKNGQAEREEVVVSGWVKDDGKTGGGVDALGLVFDKEGNLYFGLGCADYSNAYRLRDGKAHYDFKSERGTILKVSADRKRRQIVCTGIRFPYGLAFNRHGDLFCTDQEGETWLPGGNPLDELNHIIPGRHYGFPPRHNQHLPKVVDEAPVVAFSPQHQSSCGLVFNETGPGRKAFGPASWEGDALVAGFSRGKLWRVRLIKTPAGYVGRATLIAALKMLTLDMAISPAGDLVVTCHGGLPDWGTGPSGKGRLFKISYTGRDKPQPVVAWPAGPMEVRVAFDRPLEPIPHPGPLPPGDRGRGASIVFGEHVRAADRYEVLRPGYASVAAQQRAFSGKLGVASAKLASDQRTVILATDPHPMHATYALTLPFGPGSKRPEDDSAIDLAYDPTGAAAVWTGAPSPAAPSRRAEEKTERSAWSGWLPHLDLEVSRAMTAGSAEHDRLRMLLSKPGRLALKTKLQLPAGTVFLRLVGNVAFEVETPGQTTRSTAADQDQQQAQVKIPSQGKPVAFHVDMVTGTARGPVQLHISYHTDRDPTQRPLPLEWQYLPWAPDRRPEPPPPGAPPPELAGGDWKRGEALFFGKEPQATPRATPQATPQGTLQATANCAACHSIRGKGGTIGPDLSNLSERDAAAVLRDIIDPSAAINPDYVAYRVTLKTGRVLTGIVRADKDDQVRIFDSEAKETIVRQSDIEELQPSAVSVMPKGYGEQLGKEKLRDLLVFLTGPAADSKLPGQQPPPPRSRADVEAVLRTAEKPAPVAELRTLNVVLVAGPKDHGPGEHDYPAWQRKWQDLLRKAPHVRVSTASGWPGQGHWDLADVIVFYYWNHDWSEEKYKQLDAFLARGGGVVALHSAVIEDKEPEKLALRLGLASHPRRSKYRHGPLELRITAAKDPITRGLTAAKFVDESYWPLFGEVSRVHVLATTEEEGKPRPMLWTYEPGKGRVFCTILGHYSWTFDDPLFRVLVLRGLAWTAGEPVDRFNDLVTEAVQLRGGR